MLYFNSLSCRQLKEKIDTTFMPVYYWWSWGLELVSLAWKEPIWLIFNSKLLTLTWLEWLCIIHTSRKSQFFLFWASVQLPFRAALALSHVLLIGCHSQTVGLNSRLAGLLYSKDSLCLRTYITDINCLLTHKDPGVEKQPMWQYALLGTPAQMLINI